MNDSPLWEPSTDAYSESIMAQFMASANRKECLRLKSYADLYTWSIQEPEKFWALVWTFFDVKSARRWDQVLLNGDQMPGARWFRGARLNFAENLLRYRDDHPALIFHNESGTRRELSYRELYRQVAGTAESLREAGVNPGDRVAGYMPNMPETIIAMLATTAIGAIWSSTSPDFGTQGVYDRFGQIEPKVLFTADGYTYNGRRIDSLARVRELLPSLKSVQQVVVVPHLAESVNLSDIPNGVALSDFQGSATDIEFTPLPFDHPLYILYSSGTTGQPKCIVHGAGGVLLQHLKELGLHTNLHREDVLFYFTTCGWMMWNWQVSGLALGATLVLYDGSPLSPSPDSLIQMAEQEAITIFGTSAKYLSALDKSSVARDPKHSLPSLRTILSTGSPLMPENYDYVFENLKHGVQISSISGGTDIVSCFALGNPIMPVWRGELQCRGLGMAVEIFDETGRSIRGRPGELVCTRPFPAMPVAFWNDPSGARYRHAYFDRFPGVWRHGDWAELTGHDGIIIYGRSDAVLNPGGVRIGTAEIYRQVEKLPEIVESIAVGQEWKGDIRVVLFVRLQPGNQLDDTMRQRIRTIIRENTTPRHVPAKILEVKDIPRTRSGKITELAVRKAVHGRPIKNTQALANPEALEEYKSRPELAED